MSYSDDYRHELIVWDDLQPGDRCQRPGCDHPARYIGATFTMRDGHTYRPAENRWCARHRPSAPKGWWERLAAWCVPDAALRLPRRVRVS